MIIIPNIDGKIWDLEYKVNEIWQELSSTGQIVLSLNSEGPCANDIGLYALLDNLCDSAKIDKTKIKIITCNQLEQHADYKISQRPPIHFVSSSQEFYQEFGHELLDKTIGKDLKHFALMIGRSNWVRLWLAGNLYSNYPDSTLLSYHWKLQHDFHRPHLGLDDMLQWNAGFEEVNNALRLLIDCPMVVDAVDSYPILRPQHLSICQFYHTFFLEVVCETYFSGNTFFPTEKTWRSVICRTPFIVHGPVGYLMNLKKLGFKTFDRWWNEDYDDYGHDIRINKMLKIINDLSKKSADEIEDMYREMLPVLDHNLNIFMNLSSREFTKAFAYDR